jgi:DNA-binding winged helix-turn-helix (wHTH) protein
VPKPIRSSIIRFAGFEFDCDSEELRYDGTSLKLQTQPAKVLAFLIQRAGEIVTRKELMEQVWGSDTFVDFEQGLNYAIRQIRIALHDDPEQPRFLQTLPRKGYRFIAPIEGVSTARAATNSPVRFLAFPFRLTNATSDLQHLETGLPESISNLLADLNAFSVRSVQLAKRFDPANWDPREVAKEADVDVILSGTVSSAPSNTTVLTQLLDARTSEILWSKQWEVKQGELQFLPQAIVQSIVRRLLHGQPYPVSEESSGDSIAFDLYLKANHLAQKRNPENMTLARDLYLACVERDPNDAPAWANLGRCYRFLDKFVEKTGRYSEAAEKAFARAFELNPDLGLAHTLYTPLQADAGHAIEAMARLLKRAVAHSNDAELYAALVHACRYCGLLDASLAAHQRATKLDPNLKTSVAHTYFCLGDYERAIHWYGTGPGLYLDAVSLASSGRKKEAAALLWSRQDMFHLIPILTPALHAYLNDDLKLCIEILEASLSECRDPEMQFYAARQAAVAGAHELANELLSKSVVQGYFSSYPMTHDPWLKPLQTTKRFQRTLLDSQKRESKTRSVFDAHAGSETLHLKRKPAAARS